MGLCIVRLMLVLSTLQFTVFLCVSSCVMVLVDSLPLVGRNGTVLHVGYQQGLDVLWFLLIVCHKWGEMALYCTLAINKV